MAAAAAVLVTGVGGCDILTEESARQGLVATYRAPGVDFASLGTFAIVTHVGDVTGSPPGPIPSAVDAPALLVALTVDLESRGFRKVADVDPLNPPAQPPLAAIGVNVIGLDLTGSAQIPPYWVGLGGYWDPSHWGFAAGVAPAYPWTWQTFTPKAGTLLVELLDLQSATATSVPVVWAALCYDVSSTPGEYNTSQVIGAVNQAFAQAPYLRVP